MTNTQNITLREGDTVELVVPVVDGDSPAATFFDEVDAPSTTIEFTIAGSDSATSAKFTGADPEVTVTTDLFQNTLVSDNEFDSLGSIPGDEPVIVVAISATATQQLDTSDVLVYALRLNTDSGTVTVLDGQIAVESTPPFA
jgi:hypothetical protein